MKVGDYVTLEEIVNQSECRWVLLTDLVAGDHGTKGGIIRFIGDTKREAGEEEFELFSSGVDTLLVCGALEPLCVGGVFAE